MMADEYKPLVVFGISGLLFFGIIVGWKQTQRGRTADIAQALRANFLSSVFAQGASQLHFPTSIANTAASSTEIFDSRQ